MEENTNNTAKAYSIDFASASLEEDNTATQDITLTEDSTPEDEDNYTLMLYGITQEVTIDDGNGSKKTEQQVISLIHGISVDLPNATYIDAQGKELSATALFTTLSYHKEIYQPGCLKVIVETQAALSYFRGAVTLKYKGNVVASNYYIFEKKKKAGYVTLWAYSVDKFLTIDKFSQAFTGKKLYSDILESTLRTYWTDLNSNISAFCNNITPKTKKEDFRLANNSAFVKNLQHLTDSSREEAVLPYCVQYEESFHDFLVRICNRNGEFMYVEDNKLHIGVNTSTVSANITDGEIEYNEAGWDGMDEAKTAQEDSLDKKVWPNVSKPSIEDSGITKDADSTNLLAHTCVYPKEYYQIYTPYRESGTNNYVDIWDLMNPINEYVSFATRIAEASTFGDGLGRATAELIFEHSIAAKFRDTENEKFKNEVADVYDVKKDEYLYASRSCLVNDAFYKKIFQNEEKAERRKVTVSYSTCKNYKLGDILTIGESANRKYVVYRINANAQIVSDATESKDTPRYNESFEMLLLPLTDEDKAYPLPMPEKRFRKASPQRARVVVNKDPSRMGRVRISYPWQGDEESVVKNTNVSPWIRVSYPMASADSGFMFTPSPGDEVLVDYEDGNVERPYVSGTFYNSKNMPARTAKSYSNTTKSITSVNGHHISFFDQGSSGSRFLANMIPGYSLVSKFGKHLDLVNFEKRFMSSKNLGGGFEIADSMGVYTIKGSTNGRNITISSPCGDIKLNAYTGITIDSPTGDVKIKGKNVCIEALNKLEMKSGTNLNPYFRYFRDENPNFDNFKNIAKNALNSFAGSLAKLAGLDLSFHRTWLEVLFKPIGGNMLIKSNRFMHLEAGKGETSILSRKKSWEQSADGLNYLNHRLGRYPFSEENDFNAEANVYTEETLKTRYAEVKAAFVRLKSMERYTKTIVPFISEIRALFFHAQPKDEYSNRITVKNLVDSEYNWNDIKIENSNEIGKISQLAAELSRLFRNYNDLQTELNNINQIGEVNIDTLTEYKTLKENAKRQMDYIAGYIKEKLDNCTIPSRKNDTKTSPTAQDFRKTYFKVLQGQANHANLYTFNPETLSVTARQNNAAAAVAEGSGKKVLDWVVQATGFKGFLDENVWTKMDSGTIYISADKDKSFKLNADGDFVAAESVAASISLINAYINKPVDFL